MNATATDHITIIGAGKLGSSLFNAFNQAGYITQLIDKEPVAQLKSAARANIVLITVQDSKIESVCNHIAPATRPNTVVAHCSGALGNQPLKAAKKANCLIGSAHPLNTFPTKAAAKRLLNTPNHHTHCFISAEQDAQKALSDAFSRIGFKISLLNDDAKIAYHTACVFLCNYLTSLAELGLSTAASAGLNREVFWSAVQPLMHETLKNITSDGTAAALSGPIARGDTTTITRHVDALQGAPKLTQEAYKVLGKQALELAQSRGELGQLDIDKIKTTLTELPNTTNKRP